MWKKKWNFLGIRDFLLFFQNAALSLFSKIEIIWKNSSLKQRLINVARQIWVKIDCILRMLRALGRKYSVLKILWQITYHFEAWNKNFFVKRPRSFSMVVANVTLTICGATLTYTQIRVYSYVSRWKRIQMATTILIGYRHTPDLFGGKGILKHIRTVSED